MTKGLVTNGGIGRLKAKNVYEREIGVTVLGSLLMSLLESLTNNDRDGSENVTISQDLQPVFTLLCCINSSNMSVFNIFTTHSAMELYQFILYVCLHHIYNPQCNGIVVEIFQRKYHIN